jgi:NAD(P)-dependent dehydrogenase (short-subunit alcohol dehydrogenase family)
MKVDLSNRIALVSGAAGAVGRCVASALADNGAIVAAVDACCPKRVCKEIRERGGNAHDYLVDVSDPSSVNALVSQVESELGPVDILINSDGDDSNNSTFPVHQFPDEEWHRILRADLDGVFHCSRAVSARMVERRRGAIINIASALGIVPAPLYSARAAAKAAVMNFTRSHALEVGKYGIRVNGVAPGMVLTDDSRPKFYSPENKEKADSWASHIPLGAPGQSEDIAAAVQIGRAHV